MKNLITSICILTILFLTQNNLSAQTITSAKSGNWSESDTWVGGNVPTSANDVIIASGHTVTVDVNTSACNNISFGATTSKLAMAEGSVLSVYGNFTLNSTSHTAFSSWAPGAKLKFAGSAAQSIINLSTSVSTTTQTFFMELQVDKSGDTLRIPDADVKLNIGTSLEILNGNFRLGTAADIQGRNFDGSAATTPTITVGSNGSFFMAGGASHIGSGTSGTPRPPIGKVTIHGRMNVLTTSTNRINFSGVDIESGGNLTLSTGAHSRLFAPGIVTIKNGGTLTNTTTTNVWQNDTSGIDIKPGGVFRTNSETTPLPSIFINNGTVRYGRSGDQTIIDMDYYRLELSFSGTKTWTLGANRVILDSLEINNSVPFVITATSPRTVTVNGTLRLTSGSLNNSSPNVTLALANGTTISRATGTITTAPAFLGNVNLRYTSTIADVTTGPEMPSSPTVLNNLTLVGSKFVKLGSDVTVNGELRISGGFLSLGNYNLTLSETATTEGTFTDNNMVVTSGTGELRKRFSGTGSFTFPVGDSTDVKEYSPVTLNFTSGTFSSPAYVGVRVVNEKHAENTSTNDFINRWWRITSSGITNFACDADFIYADGDIVGTESNFVLGQLTNQWNVVGTCNPITNTLSAVGLSSFSDFTGGEPAALPVQLASFIGNVIANNKVKLEWETISEINNFGFYVEKYSASINDFVTVSELIPGAGTTLQPHRYSWIDENAIEPTLQYRLKQVDFNGLVYYYGPIMLNPTGVLENSVPFVFALHQNYPNPFNPSTVISFTLDADNFTTLKVYDILGNKICSLFEGNAIAGKKYDIKFDASNLPSGIYLYQLKSGKNLQAKKMLIMK